MKTYALAVHLTKMVAPTVESASTITLHLITAMNESEAKGLALEWAMEEKPGFAIQQILIQEVKQQIESKT